MKEVLVSCAATLCFVSLLIVLIYTCHMRQGQQQRARELFEGYDRCTTAADQSFFDSPRDQAARDAWQKARDGCRDFYFSGGRP